MTDFQDTPANGSRFSAPWFLTPPAELKNPSPSAWRKRVPTWFPSAAEWAKHNITVNAIAPGVFETPLNTALIHRPARRDSILSHTPMKRFGQLEEIKGAAIFLASDSASFVTGAFIAVDGGFMAQGIGE